MSRPALAAGLAALALAAPSAQQPVFKSGVDVVLVDVSVVRGRNPVTGLTARDFILRDNGVVQQVDDVSIGTVPLDVSLLVAVGGSTARDLEAFRSSIDRMRALLRPDDRVRVIGFGTIVRTIVPMQPADAPLPLDALQVTRSSLMTPLFDALFYALAWPAPPDRRHLAVVFSDGFDTWSILGADRIGPIADRADGVLHVVISATPSHLVPENPTVEIRTPSGNTIRSRESTARLQAQNDRWRASQGAVFDAAHRTGGAIHRLSDRVAAFEQILETFRSSYVLRYTPRGVDREGWHALDVSIARPGTFTVRARRGYQAGRNSGR
jgi:VWFA-related protein